MYGPWVTTRRAEPSLLDEHPATILTQSPVVYNGVIFIGTSSNEEHWATDTKCCSFAASMNAIDLKAGSVIWTPLVPMGYTGGTVLSSTPAIDAKRGVVYITTGNNGLRTSELAYCEAVGRQQYVLRVRSFAGCGKAHRG